VRQASWLSYVGPPTLVRKHLQGIFKSTTKRHRILDDFPPDWSRRAMSTYGGSRSRTKRRAPRHEKSSTDVHKNVHKNVHSPGQGVMRPSVTSASPAPARAVKVGEPEASDKSGVGPRWPAGMPMDTMEPADSGPGRERLFFPSSSFSSVLRETPSCSGTASHCQCKCVVQFLGGSSVVVEASPDVLVTRGWGSVSRGGPST
jgi:hypothetical protein